MLLAFSTSLHMTAALRLFRRLLSAKSGSIGRPMHAPRVLARLAEQRLLQRLRSAENRLKELGWSARCWTKPLDESDSVHWPAKDVAILITF